MQENIDKKLTLDEIADALFFSKSYIKKVCVKETGQSPLHYFSCMKIEKSKELFSRGMTTREYRNSVLRDLQE